MAKEDIMLSVGIDFGTSNSSVAVYDGRDIRLIDLDPAAPDPRVMKSLVYFERTGGLHFGRAALDTYLTQNTGRAVQYEMRRIGEVSMTFAEVGTMIKDAFALIDVNEPGRLFQSLKRFLSVTSFQATNVFGHNYTVEELLSLLARHILGRIEAEVSTEDVRITVGWPVRFSEDTEADRLARYRAREAWRLAGVEAVDFVEEPIGAIRHFGHTRERQDEHVLVFDFGGGTLDVCVARLHRAGVSILSTHGVPLGGDLLDSRLVETELTPLFGERAHYKSNGLPLPHSLFTHLKTWQSIVELSRPRPFELIRRASQDTDQPEQLAALEALVTKNYGLALFQAVEQAKIELSSEASARVRLNRDAIALDHEVSRVAFEAVVRPQVEQARACVLEAVQLAEVRPEAIDLVLTTGGSSAIPVFRRMLADASPNAELRETSAFTSVAAGLALPG
jgi:hypothetical chaperone protein